MEEEFKKNNTKYRVSCACKNCRRLHIACNKERPCQYCKEHELECIEGKQLKRGRKARNYTMDDEINQRPLPNFSFNIEKNVNQAQILNNSNSNSNFYLENYVPPLFQDSEEDTQQFYIPVVKRHKSNNNNNKETTNQFVQKITTQLGDVLKQIKLLREENRQLVNELQDLSLQKKKKNHTENQPAFIDISSSSSSSFSIPSPTLPSASSSSFSSSSSYQSSYQFSLSFPLTIPFVVDNAEKPFMVIAPRPQGRKGGTIIATNKGFAQTLGYSERELVGEMPRLVCMVPSQTERVTMRSTPWLLCNKMHKLPTLIVRGPVVMKSKNGEMFDVITRFQPFFDNDSEGRMSTAILTIEEKQWRDPASPMPSEYRFSVEFPANLVHPSVCSMSLRPTSQDNGLSRHRWAASRSSNFVS